MTVLLFLYLSSFLFAHVTTDCRYLLKEVGNGSTAKGQPKIMVSDMVSISIGGRPLAVDRVGTIEHEIATNKRFNYSYSNLSQERNHASYHPSG
jgi:hypothetical protein